MALAGFSVRLRVGDGKGMGGNVVKGERRGEGTDVSYMLDWAAGGPPGLVGLCAEGRPLG